MATLVYQSLSDMAPAYLAADCQLVYDEGRRQLRSATSSHQGRVLWGEPTATMETGLKLWNSLPSELPQADISFQRFKRLLKTLFVPVLRSWQIVTN